MLLRRCLSFNHCKLVNLQFGILRQIGPNRSFFIDMPLLFPFLYHFSFFLSLLIFFVVFLTKRFCAFDSLEKWFSTFLIRGATPLLCNNLEAPLTINYQKIIVKFINWRHPAHPRFRGTRVENHWLRAFYIFFLVKIN